MNKYALTFLAALMMLIAACSNSGDSANTGNNANSNEQYENKVKHHSLSDPTQLNPVNSTDEQGTYMAYQVCQTLVNIDFKTYEMIPVLAKERAVFGTNDAGKTTMDMEIREAAVWDNGDPITGHDVAFSLKIIKAPKTDCMRMKPYFEYIEDVQVDKENPKKFKIVCARPYMIAETALTELYILPQYVYDPEKLTDKVSIYDLTHSNSKLEKNEDLNKFADYFNSEKFKRTEMAGSGPYVFDRWETNARVVFKLKKDWWGHKLAQTNHWYQAYPEEIVYESINDLTTAVVALKGEKIDCMRGIEPKDFVEDLKKSAVFTDKFETSTPPVFSYDYMGINLRNEKFQDLKTRKALAHIMDVDQLIESFCYGLGERVASFTHPSIKKRQNPDVVPYEHNIDLAKKLLAEAGWEDTDSDGVLDKEIDGERVPFKIAINYNNGNNRRERSCLIFQEKARKAGIEVAINPLEWSVLIDRLKQHEFEMYVGGWISSPLESDPKQIWHTESYNGGSNYVGFGNQRTDELIDNLRKTVDEDVRAGYYKELHAIIHAEVPYIFLLAQKGRVAIHKKYDSAYGSGIRPGYYMNAFQVATAATPN